MEQYNIPILFIFFNREDIAKRPDGQRTHPLFSGGSGQSAPERAGTSAHGGGTLWSIGRFGHGHGEGEQTQSADI